MLDDVAEKARRNLLVVSSGILAVWALGIPLDGKLVGAVDLSAVEPWRAWLAASCVLLYFAARYYLAPSTAKEWSTWTRRRQFHLEGQLKKVMADAFNLVPAATQGKLKLDWHDMRGNDALVFSMTPPAALGARRGRFMYSWHYGSMGDQSKNIKLPDGTPCPTDVLEGEFKYSYSFYLASHWRSLVHAYRPSWRLLELSFPWMLAFGAAVVCVCKLAASLYYSFPFVRQLLPA